MTFSFSKIALYAFLVVLCTVLAGTVFFFAAPLGHPRESSVTVPSGTTVRGVADMLQKEGALRFRTAFLISMRLTQDRAGVVAGVYALPGNENAFVLANRFSRGITEMPAFKVTIPEGSTTKEISAILSRTMNGFDTEKFFTLAKPHEGYLFPETYFFAPNASPESIIALMQQTFDEKLNPLQQEVSASGRSLSDVIIMASILEKEARQSETRKVVAGILWNRIDSGMPLQVDAPFGYILGISGYSPTLTDLKLESPYNTYLHRGLPPGPIGNPGLDSIEAALHPTKTDYLYYLTDKNGNIYYAKTFAEHLANKARIR